MFKYNDQDVSLDQINKAAQASNLSIEEYINKTGIKVTSPDPVKEEGKSITQNNNAAEGANVPNGTTALDTGLALENGSLELQEISLEEKKKLPYKTRQQLSRRYTEKIKKVFTESEKAELSKNYFNAVSVSDEEILDDFQQKYFKLDGIERPAEYDRAFESGAMPTKRYINDYETDLKNHLIKENKLKEYEKYKETGVLNINEDAKNSILSSLKYNKAQDFFKDLTEEERAQVQGVLENKEKNVVDLFDNSKLIEEKQTSFKNKFEPKFSERNKAVAELKELEELYGGPIINDLGYSEHSPKVIEQYKNIVTKIENAESQINFEEYNAERQSILQELDSFNKNLQELKPVIENSNDIASGLKALKLEYSIGQRFFKQLEKAGAGAAVLGATALEALVNDDNILLDTKVKILQDDAINYYRSLSQDIEKDFVKTVDFKDLSLDNFSTFVAETLADNSLSIAAALLPGAGGIIAKGTSKAVQIATKKALTNLSRGIFFATSGGGKYADIASAKKDAATAMPLLKEKLLTAEYEFERKQIQDQINFYQDNLNYSSLQMAASALIYGTAEAAAESFGSLRIVNGIGDFAKVANKNIIKKLSFAGTQVLKGVGIEEAEETLTQLAQNLSDISILKEDKSVAQGINKEFFVKTAITSAAIGGPAHTNNIYNIAKSELNTLDDTNKNRKLRNELISITENLNNNSATKSDRKKLNARRNEILEEAAISDALNLHKVNKLSQKQFEEVFNIANKQRKKIKAIQEIASSSLDPQLKNKLFNEASQEYKALDFEKSNILNQKLKETEDADQAFAISLYNYNKELIKELMPKGGNVIELNAIEAVRLFQKNVNEGMGQNEAAEIMNANAFVSGKNIYLNTENVFRQISENKSAGLYAAVSPVHELLHIKLTSEKLSSVNEGLRTSLNSFQETITKTLKEKQQAGNISEKNLKDLQSRFDLYTSYFDKNGDTISYEEIELQAQKSKLNFEDYIEKEKIKKEYDIEEAFVAISDAIQIGALSLDDFNANYEIRNLFNNVAKIISPNFNLFAKLNTTENVFDYLKNYSKSYLKSGVKIVMDDDMDKIMFSLAEDASNKVQKIYDEQGIAGIYEIMDEYKPMANKIAQRYRDRPGFTTYKEDLVTSILDDPTYGVMGLALKYNPEENKGVPLAAYINKYLAARSITLANQLLGKDEASTFKSDVTEVKDVTATETAEDAILASEEIAKEKPKKIKPKLKEKIIFPSELTQEITSSVTKFASLASKDFTKEQSKNRTSAEYINNIKADLAESLRKPITKYIKEQGLEQFLIENRENILDNFTTTFLSKHPFFRKGILKRVNGEWIAPTRISAYKYDWVDEKGNKLKIDRDSAGGRGLTSGPEMIIRNPKIKEILKENEYVDYHFQDGALRNKIKVNALDSLSRQLAAEVGFEILQEDIIEGGPISETIGEYASVYGIEFGGSVAETVVKSIERGNIKLSKSGLRILLKDKMNDLEKFEFLGADNASVNKFSFILFSSNRTFTTDFINNIWDEVYADSNIRDEIKQEIFNVFENFYTRRAWKVYQKKIAQIRKGSKGEKFATFINNLIFEQETASDNINSLLKLTAEEVDPKLNFYQAVEILNKVNNWFIDSKKLTPVEATKNTLSLLGRAFANGKNSYLFNNTTLHKEFIEKNNRLSKEEIAGFELKDVVGGKSIYYNEENVKGKFDPQRASAFSIDEIVDPSKMNIKERNDRSEDAKKEILDLIDFLKDSMQSENSGLNSMSVKELGITLKALLSTMGSTLKIAANLEYIVEIPGLKSSSYVYEHVTPSSYLARAIASYVMGLDSSITISQLKSALNSSRVALVPKAFDNILTKGKLTQKFPVDFELGMDPLYRYYNSYIKSKFPKLTTKYITQGKEDITFDNFDRSSSANIRLSKSAKSMNSTFNEMLERKKGIAAETIISKATAKLIGQKKGKLKVFVPPSADDLVGMLYNFLGSGKQGDADMKFFEEKLLKPLARANYNLNTERQLIKSSYYNLIKANKGINKKLRAESTYKYYNNDAAVRVYMWTKLGYDIPGINASDKKGLLDSVIKNPELLKFAEQLINVPNKKESWLEPADDWTASTIEMDLQEILSKIGRARIFEEFIVNADIIFSEDNLNKIEAAYGPNLRSALEDMLYRIKKGQAREIGSNQLANKYLNWVRGSVATTMFFNVRSALLQQLSIVNFTNWEENNPIAQAKLLADPKKYAEYWVKIFNSDWMKERRQGLKTDINESELAARIQGSKNKNKALLSYILEKGFSLTKYGDNFAIATGGAPFLYNREQKYIKEGMTETKAKEEAFLDFQEIAERTQQSSRQDLLSNQQVSVVGRLFLAFQNTPMQMTRLTKKAVLDLINGRGSRKANLSRIVYYSTIQNMIFSFFQNALFALTGLDDEDEDDQRLINTKTERAINSVLDGVLRGSGVGGATIASLKNALITWKKENDKGWTGDDTKVIIELLNVSPAIGIKARKIHGAMKSYKYNKKILNEIGYDNPNHPYYGIAGSLTSAAFNVPLDRIFTKASNLKAATQQEAEAWQRAALFLGYNTWDIGLKDPEIEEAGEKTKKKGISKGRSSGRNIGRKTGR